MGDKEKTARKGGSSFGSLFQEIATPAFSWLAKTVKYSNIKL